MSDLEDALNILATLTQADIRLMFGPAEVARGRQLFQSGQVQNRELVSDLLEGHGIQASVIDDGKTYLVGVFAEDEDQLFAVCDCPKHGDCAHTVALLSAWLEEPSSFAAPDEGGFLNTLMGLPWLRGLLTDDTSELEEDLEFLDTDVDLFLGVNEMFGPVADGQQEAVVVQSQTIQPGVNVVAADQTLRQLLEEVTLPQLRRIGRRHGFKLRGTRKADVIEQLIALLHDAVHKPDFLAGLTSEEYEVLRTLNTVYGIRDALTQDEAQRAWQQSGSKRSRKVLQQALSGLHEYGLLFPCTTHGREEHYHWLPHLASVRLPVVQPEVKAYPQRKARQLTHPADTPAVPTALALLVAFAERHPLRLRKPRPRYPRARQYPWLGDWDHDPEEVKRLFTSRPGYLFSGLDAALGIPAPQPLLAGEVLEQLTRWLGGDQDYADWLTLLAIAAEILTSPTDAKTPLMVQREHWQTWYSRPPETQLRMLFNLWRQSLIGLTELRLALQREPGLRVERTVGYQYAYSPRLFTPTDLARELSLARGFVARLLQELPANVWYDWFSFAEAAWQQNPNFLHNYVGPDVWGIAARGRKRLDPKRRGDWDRGYRPILAAILEGPLRWLGVVEVGYKGRRMVAFRLTPTGAWLLRGEGRPPTLREVAAGEAPVTWLDDETFRVLPGPATIDVLPLADILAIPTQRAFVYKLSDEGIQEAFARGIEPATIATRFEKAGAPLPPATRQRIETLWSRFGYIHLYEKLTVLELADDLALREILANTSLHQHMVHQFSPRLVVVEDSAVDELVEELIKKGYTPKVES